MKAKVEEMNKNIETDQAATNRESLALKGGRRGLDDEEEASNGQSARKATAEPGPIRRIQ
jgi:hypothetical protein